MPENDDKKGIPPMVNFDNTYEIPGSISSEERFQQDLEKLKKKDEQILESRPDLRAAFEYDGKSPYKESVNELEIAATEPITDMAVSVEIPEEEHKPVEQVIDTIAPPIMEPPSVNPVSHTSNTIAEAIKEHERAINPPPKAPEPTPIEIPDTFTDAMIQDITENTSELRNAKFDLEIIDDDEQTYINVPEPQEKVEEKQLTEEEGYTPITLNDLMNPKPKQDNSDAFSQEENIVVIDESPDEAPKLDLSNDVKLERVEDQAEEGTFLESLTSEEVEEQFRKELEQENKGVISSPQTLTDAQVIELNDYTTTHFRIFEAVNRKLEAVKAKEIPIDTKEIINVDDVPDFNMRSVQLERNIMDGQRKVQIVAIQSGYTCMVKPFNSRELRTFGRRQGSEDTFGFEMAIAAALFSKLSEFSCGPLKFTDWMNVTAYADMQTLFFGAYHATFPSKSLFTFNCNYCNEELSVPVDSNALACIPPGSMALNQIQAALNNQYDPRTLQNLSMRWKAIDIYINSRTRFFRVRTPSIIEFYTNAFEKKKEEFINDYLLDNIYAGYIRGVGTLDIDRYNKDGGNPVYYMDRSIQSIDRALAEIPPSEKRQFERAMLNYITKYSVAYQIPRTRCKKCGRIISQRDVNTRSLFFDAKSQMGF